MQQVADSVNLVADSVEVEAYQSSDGMAYITETSVESQASKRATTNLQYYQPTNNRWLNCN